MGNKSPFVQHGQYARATPDPAALRQPDFRHLPTPQHTRADHPCLRAARLALSSRHPLAVALAHEAVQRVPFDNAVEEAGQGVRAMIGGLLALNPYGLRGLIMADRGSGAAIALLVMGFVITFGSTAMGTAIMALGADPRGKSGGTRTPAVTDDATAVKVAAR